MNSVVRLCYVARRFIASCKRGPKVLLLVSLAAMQSAPVSALPNVVLISADDLGAMEITKAGTPNLYRLSHEGVNFTRFYAYPVCSPSRAALMTGVNPLEYRLTGITEDLGRRFKRPLARLRPPQPADRLPAGIRTLGKMMRSKGYRTGYFGKWHLGEYEGGLSALGYDTSITTQGKSHILTHVEMRPSMDVDEDARRDQFIVEQALEFIEGGDPFYLEIHNFLPHLPLEPRGDLASSDAPAAVRHAALLTEMDELVGLLLEKLEGSNTLVLFLSDNGALESGQGMDLTSNAPFRGEKGTVYEGGVRVPLIAWWPVRLKPKRDEDLAFLTDIYPLLESVTDDGWNRPQREEIVIHFPHYHKGSPASAIITDRWKLVRDYETGQDTMFDLANDIGEQRPLSPNPELSARLTSALGSAMLPVGNPDYNAELAHCENDCDALLAKPRNKFIAIGLILALLAVFLLRKTIERRRLGRE